VKEERLQSVSKPGLGDDILCIRVGLLRGWQIDQVLLLYCYLARWTPLRPAKSHGNSAITDGINLQYVATALWLMIRPILA